MIDTIVNSFDIWSDAQGIKSRIRVKSVDNISLEGIARLRELILDLAIQGKLASQDPNDEPANILLKKIEKEKEKLGINYGIKIKHDLSTQIPKGWVLTCLGIVVDLEMGQSPDGNSYNETGIGVPLINGPVEFGPGPFDKTLKTKFTTSPTKMCKEGDLLVCVRGSTTGRTNIAGFDACIGRGVAALRPFIAREYLNYFMLKSRYSILNLGTGTTFPSISKNDIINLKFLLPPLAEQYRIAAKINELMALCDKLEAEQFKNLKTHQALVKTLLETLTQAADADELQAAWERMAAHFDILFCTEDSIDQLKQTILQLAVMGKLVKQDPNDEPAGELLKKIAKEKAKHGIECNIKNEYDSSLKIPLGWILTRLGIVIELEMGQSPDGTSYNETGIGVPLINGPVEFGPGPFDKTLKTKFTTSPTKMCKEGDLLVCVRGATTGRTNIAGFDACIGRGVASLRPYFKKEYLNYFMLKSRFSVLDLGTGTTFPSISKNEILNLKFLLPPLSEQQRIISRIDELFTLCDTLKEKIQKSQNIKVLLSKNIVEKAVS